LINILLLEEDIKANLFAPSACGLIQSVPRTRVRKHWRISQKRLARQLLLSTP